MNTIKVKHFPLVKSHYALIQNILSNMPTINNSYATKKSSHILLKTNSLHNNDTCFLIKVIEVNQTNHYTVTGLATWTPHDIQMFPCICRQKIKSRTKHTSIFCSTPLNSICFIMQEHVPC